METGGIWFRRQYVLSRNARYVLSRLRYNTFSLPLNAHLSRIENSSSNAWGHQTKNTSYLILTCPTKEFTPQSLKQLNLFAQPPI